jgi:hypothetical protein
MDFDRNQFLSDIFERTSGRKPARSHAYVVDAPPCRISKRS